MFFLHTHTFKHTLTLTYAHRVSPVPLYWLRSHPAKWLETGSGLKIAQYTAKNSHDGAVSVCDCGLVCLWMSACEPLEENKEEEEKQLEAE